MTEDNEDDIMIDDEDYEDHEDYEDDVVKDDDDYQDYSVTTAVESKKGEGFYFD